MQFCLKNPGNVVNSNPNDFENPPEYNPDKFSLWWNVWLSHIVLLVKLTVKNKMHYTIKLETQDQRVHHSTQGQLLVDNYQYSLHCGWASYELMYVQIRVCVYWVKKVTFLCSWRKERKLQSLVKTTSSGQIQYDKNGTTGPLPILLSET